MCATIGAVMWWSRIVLWASLLGAFEHSKLSHANLDHRNSHLIQVLKGNVCLVPRVLKQ